MTLQSITTSQFSLETANELLAHARRTCAERGFAACIAITDAGGHLRVFERADTAPFLTAGVAIDKAQLRTVCQRCSGTNTCLSRP